jgi:hypothetical protein
LGEKALDVFEVDWRKGGVLYVDNETGDYEYLEYPCGVEPWRVLNGFMSSLESLYAFHKAANSTRAKILFDRGVLTLEKSVGEYDTQGISWYDIQRHSCSVKYHKMHIEQLNRLYNITEKETFRHYAEKWNRQLLNGSTNCT